MDLFTYGSLMCPEIMTRVAGEKLASLDAQLSGFFRSTVAGEVYPGIRPKPASYVSGVLYLSVSPQAITRLDSFEGEYYQRQAIEVVGTDGCSRLAHTYVFKPAYYHLLTQTPWSYEEFLDQGKKHFVDVYVGFDRL